MNDDGGKNWTLVLQIHLVVKMDNHHTTKPNIKCETGAQKKTGTRLCDKRLYENGLGGK